MTTSYYAQKPQIITERVQTSELAYNNLTAREILSKYDVVSQDGSFVGKADAHIPGDMDGVGMVFDAVASGVQVDVVIRGRVSNTAWAWTSGSYLFVLSGGGLGHTPPAASGDVTQRFALALTATEVEINPQRGYQLAE